MTGYLNSSIFLASPLSMDLEAIKAVAASHLNLDKQRIQYWLVQFGAALETPNLWKEIGNFFDLRSD